MTTLQRLRERLVLILIALLPVHALAVTVLTKLIAGPGHAPLPVLALWKEAMLGIVLLIAAWEIVHGILRRKAFRMDTLDALAITFALVALGATAWSGVPSRAAFLLGIKYDLVPLAAFLLLRRAEWSDGFRASLLKTVMFAGVGIAAYGILTFFLPAGFFAWLGYSDLHSLYVPDGPLAPFQLVGGSTLHRIQSAMSGPNQLGIWLLLPLSVSALGALRKRDVRSIGSFLVILLAIALTFSRAAWVAAFVVLATLAFLGQSRIVRRRMFLWVAPAVLVALVIVASVFPSVILRSASTRGHWDKPIAGIVAMIGHPLGTGLGTAGPATNRVSDACVELEAGSDASWAAAHPNLCVFVGGTKVQPTDRDCACPFLTENWYVQIGVEAGVLGFVLYLMLMGTLLWKLLRIPGPVPAALAFLGVCVCGLFLHAFEDAAVAYTAFLAIAVALAPSLAKRFA